jgi:hypothetical protein
MTCRHALDLIDAGPLMDNPAAHHAAVRRHADQCPTCGLALDAATALADDLTTLPQAPPPSELAPGVMARIARLEDAPAAARARQRATARASRSSGFSVAAVGALAAGIGAILSGRAGLSVLGIEMAGPVGPTTMTAGVITLAYGLLLYVVGLFATVGARTRSSRAATD